MSAVDLMLQQTLTSTDARLDDVLDLVDAAVEHAAAQGDDDELHRLARRLDEVAAQREGEWRALAIAAARARSVAGSPDVAPAPSMELHQAPLVEETPVPQKDAAAPAPAAVAELVYAGWWRRVFAFVIDWIVIGVALERFDVSNSAFLLGSIVLTLAYFAGLPAAANGITAGKAALGIAIRSADGMKLGYLQALGRIVVMCLLWVTVIGAVVDAILAGTDSKRQSVHDKVAGTIVVRRR